MKITLPLYRTPLSHQQHVRTANGRHYKDTDLASYQQEMAMLAKSQIVRTKFKRLDENYEARFIFYMKNRIHGDGTNICKALEDAMEGILYTNDKFCKRLLWEIHYDSNNPRVIIEVNLYAAFQKEQDKTLTSNNL